MSMLPTQEVLMLIGSMQPVTTKALKDSGDWQPRQPSNAIYQLKQHGLVETIEGEHWLTEKGQSELKDLDKNPAKKLTEMAAEVVKDPAVGAVAKKMISAPPGNFRPAEPAPAPEPETEPENSAVLSELLGQLSVALMRCCVDVEKIKNELEAHRKAGGAA